jgi:hypothetical protein
MYYSFKEVVDGMTKNLFGVFNLPLPFFLLIWLWLLCVFLLPICALVLYLLGYHLTSFSLSLAIIAVLTSIILWGVSIWSFKQPTILAVFYPLTVIILVMLAARSAWFRLGKQTVFWKGREL